MLCLLAFFATRHKVALFSCPAYKGSGVVDLLENYSLPGDIGEIVRRGRRYGLTRIEGCVGWEDLIAAFDRYLSAFATFSRNNPIILGGDVSNCQTAAERRQKFQEIIFTHAAACAIADKLRCFTEDQKAVEARLDHIVKLGLPSSAGEAVRGCISAVDFYQHNSGGQSSELHKNILEWLPPVIATETAGPEIEATVQVVTAALREAMFKPIMDTATITSIVNVECPITRDDLTKGVRKWAPPIQEANAA